MRTASSPPLQNIKEKKSIVQDFFSTPCSASPHELFRLRTLTSRAAVHHRATHNGAQDQGARARAQAHKGHQRLCDSPSPLGPSPPPPQPLHAAPSRMDSSSSSPEVLSSVDALSSSSPRPRPTLSSSSPRGAQGGAQRRCLSDGHMEERSPHSSLITAGSHIGS
jgi:hypothetical protein